MGKKKVIKQEFDADLFGKAVKTHRCITVDVSLSSAEKETGVTISTLSRIENGRAGSCDITTLISLCSWMNVSICDFIVH